MIEGDALIDVDGTAAMLVEYLMAQLKPKFKGQALPKHDVDGLLDKGGPLTDQQLAEAYKLLASKGFVKNLPIIPGALEGAKKLRAALSPSGRRVLWCTAPWTSSETWDYDRRWWLEKRFYANPKDVIFTHHKGLVKGCCLIDDRPDKLEEWVQHNPSGIACLHDQPSNQGYKNSKIRRFKWSDIDDLIKDLGR